MPSYRVSKCFPCKVSISSKVAAVMRMFGVSSDKLAARSVKHHCEVEINPGDIVYISGPSGSGKTVLLRELEKSIPAGQRVNLDDIELVRGKSVIDCFDGDVVSSFKLLSTAGFSDVFCILNEPAKLSDGQKWRFKLAMALALGRRFVFADEFCCGLDRVTAAVISYNVHKFARRNKVTFILASSHEDTLLDLQPDTLIIKELSGPARVIHKNCRVRY